MKSKPWLIILSLLILLLIWQLAVWFGGFPAFILPTPEQVGIRFVQVIKSGSLIRNTLVTLYEVLAGLALGVSVASVLGYILARSLHLERLLIHSGGCYRSLARNLVWPWALLQDFDLCLDRVFSGIG